MNTTTQPLPSGSLDPNFGVSGIVNLNALGSGAIIADGLTLTPEQKICIAGFSDAAEYVLARQYEDGDPDGTFGMGGGFAPEGMTGGAFGTYFSRGYAVQVLPDGRLILKGHASINGEDYPAIACFDVFGALDYSFGTNGCVILAPPFAKVSWTGFKFRPLDPFEAKPGSAYPTAACKINAGKRILVSARIESKTAIVSLDTKGALDTGFAGAGYVILERGAPGIWLDVVHTLSGQLIAAGSRTTPGETVPHPYIARYYGDGTLDKTFGNQGSITLDTVAGHFTDLILTSSGKMVGVGYSVGTQPARAMILGRNQNGSPDTAFNNGNPVLTSVDNAVCGWTGAAIASTQQKIVVTGGTYGAHSVAVAGRFNSDGRPDSSFGNSGLVRLDLGKHTYSSGALVQSDQKIVTCGTVIEAHGTFGYVARLMG